MRNLVFGAAVVGLWSIGACQKTGKGEYEIEKPVIGTTTDTIHTPTVETGTVKDTVNVPKVDVQTEKKEVTLPRVRINKPRN